MSKDILVLTGSPRKGGNSDLMADAFIKGAKKAGHTVTKYKTAAKNIQGCKACDTCFSNGDACSFDDDFNELAPLLAKADTLVFVTPLYWYSFPAQLKAAIDKLYAFNFGNVPLKIKECMLLVCAEENNEDIFAGIVKSYELIAAYKKWTDLGHLIVPGVSEKGDVKHTDGLKKAEALGAGITG